MSSTPAHLLGFLLASTLMILLPGPDFLLLIRNTLRGGSRRGMGTAAGAATR